MLVLEQFSKPFSSTRLRGIIVPFFLVFLSFAICSACYLLVGVKVRAKLLAFFIVVLGVCSCFFMKCVDCRRQEGCFAGVGYYIL